MPKHVKRIECCYCSASSLVNLNNPNEMHLICSGCGAKLSVDKMQALPQAATPSRGSEPQKQPIRREMRFEWVENDRSRKHKSRKDGGGSGNGRRKKRRSFLCRLEDVWDEIEDIFD